jgi:hypothetical protein
MTLNSPSTSPGHPVVPASQIKAFTDALTQVAGQLEEIACQLAEAQIPSPATQVNNNTEMRVEQALLANVTVGSESFQAAEIADAVAAELELHGEPVPVMQIRRLLPPLMLRLFKSKLSCSVTTPEGRYARGYRGLAAR